MENKKIALSKNFQIKFWDDKCVAYHVPTGNTHIIDSLSFEILNAFKDDLSQGLSIECICSTINRIQAVNVKENRYTDDITETYIRQLTIAGILERLPIE